MEEIAEIIKNLECEENALYNKIKRLTRFIGTLEYEKIDDMKEREYYGMD